MKIFGKFTSILVAFTLSMSLMPMSSSASGGTYYKGDVDGDDSATFMDLAYLRNVLRGVSCSSDDRMTQRLDVNLDGIIDSNDVTALSEILIGDSSSTLRVYSTVTRDIETSSPVTYRKVRASNGNSVSIYTLSVLDEIPDESDSMISVASASYSGPVSYCPTAQISTSIGTFSGVVVDDHTILTAASSLYDKLTHTYASNVKCMIYNSSGSAVPLWLYSTYYHIPTQFVSSSNSSEVSRYNYALLTVSSDLSGYGIPDIGIARKAFMNTNTDIYSSGIYGSLTGNKIDDYSLYYNISYNADKSGSAVYTIDSFGNKTIIGFNARNPLLPNVTLGRRIDTDILQFIFGNIYLG